MSSLTPNTPPPAAIAPSKGVYLPVPTNFEEAYRVAKVLAASDLVPKDYRDRPENCLVAMQWGSDIGLPGLQALQNIAVINGRPSIWGDAALALAKNSPQCDDIEERIEGEGEAMVAICVARRRGKAAVEQRFSVADAKKANLWGKTGPWQQYPRRMLQMRARSFAIRDAFPDTLRGLILAEEAQDFEKDMGMVERVDRPAPAMPGAKRTEPVMPAARTAAPAPTTAPAQPPAEPAAMVDVVDSETGEVTQERVKTKVQAEQPAPAPRPAGGASTAGLIKVVRIKLQQFGVAEQRALEIFGLAALDDADAKTLNEVIAWAKENAQG